jgi:hypothetical protein
MPSAITNHSSWRGILSIFFFELGPDFTLHTPKRNDLLWPLVGQQDRTAEEEQDKQGSRCDHTAFSQIPIPKYLPPSGQHLPQKEVAELGPEDEKGVQASRDEAPKREIHGLTVWVLSSLAPLQSPLQPPQDLLDQGQRGCGLDQKALQRPELAIDVEQCLIDPTQPPIDPVHRVHKSLKRFKARLQRVLNAEAGDASPRSQLDRAAAVCTTLTGHWEKDRESGLWASLLGGVR